MAEKMSDLFRAKRGVAILATVIVQTMKESDPTFESRFLERLSRAYRELKDGDGKFTGDVIQEMELLSWTRELLTGFDFINGQGKPFLD